MPELVAGGALSDLGDHLLTSATRSHRSSAIVASGHALRMPEAFRADGVDHHNLDPPPERIGLLAQPVAHAAPAAARSQFRQRFWTVHGSSRRTKSATDQRASKGMPSRIQRTDQNRVSSIPSRVVGSGSGSRAAAELTSVSSAPCRYDARFQEPQLCDESIRSVTVPMLGLSATLEMRRSPRHECGERQRAPISSSYGHCLARP